MPTTIQPTTAASPYTSGAIRQPVPHPQSIVHVQQENSGADILVFTDHTLRHLKSSMISSVQCRVMTMGSIHLEEFKRS